MAKMDQSDQPVLSLNTFTVRKVVVIDGERYELLNAGELPLITYHRLGIGGEKLHQYLSSDTLTDESVGETARVLDEMVRAILKAPANVIDRLSDAQKLSVTQVFTRLQLEEDAATRLESAASPIGVTP